MVATFQGESGRDGESIPFKHRKAIGLLAYLAVTGQPHSRDTLATLPWPDHDGSSARANLRRALSPLKRNLGNQALVIDQDQVGLNPRTELGLDVDAFRTRVAVGLGHGRSSPELCADCGAALAEAAEIYSGALMAGLQPTG
jgi:DNA-binding SARP family transcriptional activator